MNKYVNIGAPVAMLLFVEHKIMIGISTDKKKYLLNFDEIFLKILINIKVKRLRNIIPNLNI